MKILDRKKLIWVDDSIDVTDLKDEYNTKILKIAYKNIEDLNVRCNNSVMVIYNGNNGKFEPSDVTDFFNFKVVKLLNTYSSWSIAKNQNRSYQINSFLEEVEKSYKSLQTDLYNIRLTSGIKYEHRMLVKIFINQYQHLEPKGFLTKSKIMVIKETLNMYCQKLKADFLNGSGRNYDFSEKSSQFKPEFIKIDSNHSSEDFSHHCWMVSSANFFK